MQAQYNAAYRTVQVTGLITVGALRACTFSICFREIKIGSRMGAGRGRRIAKIDAEIQAGLYFKPETDAHIGQGALEKRVLLCPPIHRKFVNTILKTSSLLIRRIPYNLLKQNTITTPNRLNVDKSHQAHIANMIFACYLVLSLPLHF